MGTTPAFRNGSVDPSDAGNHGLIHGTVFVSQAIGVCAVGETFGAVESILPTKINLVPSILHDEPIWLHIQFKVRRTGPASAPSAL
jgi:hypothetical protein